MRDNGLREIKGNEELRHTKAPRPVAHDARKRRVCRDYVAVGFLLMGLVTMPILILATVPLGVAVALLLRFTRK
jgi:hypothetical protein